MKKISELGMFLYQTRERLGIKKKDLANELGVSVRVITYWENDLDDRLPSLPLLYKLSKIFNISIDDMLA